MLLPWVSLAGEIQDDPQAGPEVTALVFAGMRCSCSGGCKMILSDNMKRRTFNGPSMCKASHDL